MKYLCLLYQTSFIFLHTHTFCKLFIYTLKELGNQYSFPEKQCMNIQLISSFCVQGLRRLFLILFPFGAYRALTLLPYSVVLTGQFSCFCNPITVPFPTIIPSVLKVVAVYSSKMLVLLISHWYQLTRLNPWHHSQNSHHCENHKCQQNNFHQNFLLLPTLKVQL